MPFEGCPAFDPPASLFPLAMGSTLQLQIQLSPRRVLNSLGARIQYCTQNIALSQTWRFNQTEKCGLMRLEETDDTRHRDETTYIESRSKAGESRDC